MSQQVNPVAVIPTGAVAKIIFNVTGSPEDRLIFHRYRFAPIPTGHRNSDKYMVFSECKWCARESDVSFSSVMACDLTFFSHCLQCDLLLTLLFTFLGLIVFSTVIIHGFDLKFAEVFIDLKFLA